MNKTTWKFKIFAILSIGIIGCSPFGCITPRDESTCPSIDVKSVMSKSVCPDIKTKSIVKLEKTDSSLIGSITRLEFYKGKYYIFDRDISHALFVFDSTGKFIAKTLYGKGPHELIDPWDFYIDKKKSQVLVWEQSVFKMMTFDLNLNYVSSEIHHHLVIRNFTCEGNDTVFVFAQGPVVDEMADNVSAVYDYLVYANNFKTVINRISPSAPEFVPLTFNSMVTDGEGIFFLEPLKYYIYEFDHNKVKPVLHLDFGKYTISKEDITKGPDWLISSSLSGRIIAFMDNIQANKDFLAVSFAKMDREQFIIYSRKRKDAFYSESMFKNDVLPFCCLRGLYENYFIGVINPGDLSNYYKNKKITPDDSLLPTPVDNPYLMMFSIIY